MLRTALIPFLLIAVVSSSCVKEGCTDEDAINYNAQADDDDGSCVYHDDVQDSVRQDLNQQRSTHTFTLSWDGNTKFLDWEAPVNLEDYSVLLYMEHPQFSEWIAMPYSRNGVDYYYSEEQGSSTVWVYAVENGNVYFNQGQESRHKAVILPNQYMKENPEVKEMSYSELEARIQN